MDVRPGEQKNDEEHFRTFERKFFGPKHGKESWRMLYDYEIDLLFSKPDVVTFLKTQSLRWAGHVAGMEEENPVKKLTLQKPFESRRKGRPGSRVDDIKADQKALSARVEKKGLWQGRMEGCDGEGKDSKRAVAQLVMVMVMLVVVIMQYNQHFIRAYF
jgi:hypothetical protein